MHSFVRYIPLSVIALFGLVAVSGFDHSLLSRQNDRVTIAVPAATPPKSATSSEVLLSDTENAYNPIPSPDGSMIAYVRTGWGRPGGSGGFGSSNLVSDVAVMDIEGHVLTKKPLADDFLQGWTRDGKYLICSRDYDYSIVSPNGNALLSGQLPNNRDLTEVSERVAYLSTIDSSIWIQNNFTNVKRIKTSRSSQYVTKDFDRSLIGSPKGEVAAYGSRFDVASALVPSPDEKYIAVVSRNSLEVYDRQKKSWTKFGEIIIHPDEYWDSIKPTWDPWFDDSSKLIFLTASGIVVSSPDGKSRQTILKPPGVAGLVTPSPDGNFIAFATFESRPKAIRNDLKFWGGSSIWVAPVVANSTPRQVTSKNEDTTFDLRWLNEHSLVFDRIANEPFYRKARLWKIVVSR